MEVTLRCLVVAAGLALSTGMQGQGWTSFGYDANNSASNLAETKISNKSVSKLAPKWKFTTGGDVSARAAVAKGVVYFPIGAVICGQ